MQQVYQQIRQVAAVDATVLIEGETGTGKELVARAIHALSARQDKPFIAVNGAGLTESLLASQLFGHKRGAFTGAVADHVGLFEAAHGGTLFLDEIGDIPLAVQTSLLRVLQEREITRLGETHPRKIDVRIVVATHRHLSDEVAKGTFRPDLLYRIRVARILLPPLRTRREDIPLLVGACLGQARAAIGKTVEGVSPEAMRLLLAYLWPGNVRELKSAIEYAVIRCQGAMIQPDDLPPEVSVASPEPSLPSQTPQDEQARLLAALQAAGGNRAVAARLLGISRATLYRHLARLPQQPAKLPSAEA
jgi:DNA-binding NtrC family response regulator